MCLILLSYDTHPVYRMVLAANRDEYYNRPTKPLAFHDDSPNILGGRDLKQHGMWLGVTRTGRFAAITNFRDPGLSNPDAPSRGHLVRKFLSGQKTPEGYLEQVKTAGDSYNGFNLIVGDGSGLFYYSNRGKIIQRLNPGLYGVSNHLMDTPWPKIKKGKVALENLLNGKEKIRSEDIFNILKDGSYPPDDMLPNTGVGRDWERILSPLFITSSFYGTRSSSIILMSRTGETTFIERTFIPDSAVSRIEKTREFSFRISA